MRGRRQVVALAAVIALIAAAAVGLKFWRDARVDAEPGVIPDDAEVETGPLVGDRSITLVFPDATATGYVTERRRVPSQGHPEEDLLQVLGELCAGPAEADDAIAAVPRSARPLGVFLDLERQAAVLDFSLELVSEHPGGSAAELATLTSILRTVALNFPTLQTCRILVEGGEVQTLAGHLVLDEPFELRRWL